MPNGKIGDSQAISRFPGKDSRLFWLLLLLALGVLEPRREPFDPYKQLLALLKGQRFSETRLVGLDQHPCLAASATECIGPLESDSPVARRIHRLRKPLFADDLPSTARRFHAQAIYNMAWKEFPEAFETSAELLEEAASLAPHDPEILADRAAVLTENAFRKGEGLPHFEALEASLAAVAIPDAPLESFFTLAQIQTRLNLPGAALAWKNYLVRDPDSAWSEQARGNLKRLEEPARAEEELDGSWQRYFELLGEVAAKPEELRDAQAELRATASRISALSGDRLLENSIAGLGGSDAGARLRAIAKYLAGKQAYQRGATNEARELLLAAEIELRRLADPIEYLAAYYLAACDFRAIRYRESLDMLALLDEKIGRLPYFRIRADVQWLRGVGHLNLGRPQEALESMLLARDLYRRALSREQEAVMSSLAGECSMELGKAADAWKYFRQALELREHVKQPMRKTNFLQPLVNAAREQQLLGTAELMADLLVANNRTVENPQILFLSLVSRAWVHFDRGNLPAATADFAAARELIGRLGSQEAEARGAADLAVLGAALAPNPSPALLAELDTAIRSYAEWNFNTFVHGQARVVRSNSRLHGGDPAGAAADLSHGLQIYELGLLDDFRSRWNLRKSANQLYDRWIAIVLDRLESPRAAFDIVERAKEFSLTSSDFKAGRLARNHRQLTLTELEAELPAGSLVVSFRLIGDRLLIWHVSRSGTSFHEREVNRTALRSQIGLIRLAGTGRTSVPRQAIDELSILLIGDLPEDLSLLAIVPDQELNDLPFALLGSGRNESLAETIPIVVAPSAGVLVEAQRRLAGAKMGGRVLIVSDPILDRGLKDEFSLSELSSAGSEGDFIAGLYPGAVHLRGAAARRSDFFGRRLDYDILHFATHAILDPRRPGSSFLALSPEPPNRGELFQDELYGLRLEAAPLVVLSACDSGRLTGHAEEGISTLARAFLSAGASSVLATLWTVQDDSAAFMATSFHRELHAGAPAAEALRLARVSYRQQKNLMQTDPIGWSAFQLIGASR